MDKPMKKSLTIWGVLTASLPGVLKGIGHSIGFEALEGVGDAIAPLLQPIGLLVAGIGGRRALGRNNGR